MLQALFLNVLNHCMEGYIGANNLKTKYLVFGKFEKPRLCLI
jgi:hypothetical protein